MRTEDTRSSSSQGMAINVNRYIYVQHYSHAHLCPAQRRGSLGRRKKSRVESSRVASPCFPRCSVRVLSPTLYLIYIHSLFKPTLLSYNFIMIMIIHIISRACKSQHNYCALVCHWSFPVSPLQFDSGPSVRIAAVPTPMGLTKEEEAPPVVIRSATQLPPDYYCV